jgi:protein TonB
MPRDLFGDVTRPSISIGNRKWYTLPLSLFSHSAIVVILVALPILAPAVMPSVFADDNPAWTKIIPPTPPAPPPIPRADPTPPPLTGPVVPTVAPTGINPEVPRFDPPASDALGVILGAITDARNELTPPPAAVKPDPPPPPVRVGGAIRAPQRLREVNPVYPPIAQSARVQGIVIIEATIGEDGQVTNARILRSVPLLDQAALDAVRQWQYMPTLLNGVPVPVIMTVTVNFTLR